VTADETHTERVCTDEGTHQGRPYARYRWRRIDATRASSGPQKPDTDEHVESGVATYGRTSGEGDDL
jgi:hypothetical protein